MDRTAQPIVVAFDGSDESRATLTAAAGLFSGRPLIVVSVWEPGLAYAMQPALTDGMSAFGVPSVAEVTTIDRLQRQQAAATAAAGARLAHDLGAAAEPLPVADTNDVADTLLEVAEAHDAAALAVGSRGLGAVRSRLEGSTSKRLLHHSRRPVLVVHGGRA